MLLVITFHDAHLPEAMDLTDAELEEYNVSRVEYERRRVEMLEAVKPLSESTRAFQRREIARVIELCQGNHEETAIRLGISRTTLWRTLGRKEAAK